MTATIFLVRHGAHDLLGKVLAGRMAGVGLGAIGRSQCEGLARRFSGSNVAAVVASPLDRTRETAKPIAECLKLSVEIDEDLAEVDYGEWTGLALSAVLDDPRWAAWNAAKAVHRIPGGETLLEVQVRGVRAVQRLAEDAEKLGANAAVVAVTHGDVIKTVLAYHLGMPIEHISRLQIEPGSISTLVIGDWGAQVHAINEQAS